MPEQTRLFIGNLPAGTSESELSKEFSFYGNVKHVEVKEKKSVDDGPSSTFAFVSMESDIQNINKCIDEFTAQEWKGCFLKVSVARESFMEKLKRERAEEEKKKLNQNQSPSFNNLPINIKKPVINIEVPKVKITQRPSINDYNDRNGYNSFTPMEENAELPFESTTKASENKNISKNDFDEPDSSLVIINNRSKAFTASKKLIIKSVNGGVPLITSDSKITKPPAKLTAADERRLKSMQSMRSSYNEKKSLIKNALSAVDKKLNKKIVFGDDGSAVHDSESKKFANKRKANGNVLPEKQPNAKMAKNALFNEASDSEDDGINFDIKEQFQGEAGQKLLELQARYKSDKRFVLDKRFLDDENDNAAEKVTENADDEIEGAEDDEKNRQFEILEGILGTTVHRSKLSMANNEDPTGKKLPPKKTMLRYDPSRPDHDKFMNKTAEAEVVPKKSKKERQKERLLALSEQTKVEEKPAPEVSKDRYYNVNESLNIFKEDAKPFSLLSMFGNEEVKGNINDEDEYKSQKIAKTKKNPLDSKDKNPFFYDSSDSEDDSKNDKSTKEETQQPFLPGAKIEVKPLILAENFFFSSKDERFREGLEFFLNAKPRSEKSREELKSVVKKRIQNNMRNDKYHFKKVVRQPANTKKFRKK